MPSWRQTPRFSKDCYRNQNNIIRKELGLPIRSLVDPISNRDSRKTIIAPNTAGL